MRANANRTASIMSSDMAPQTAAPAFDWPAHIFPMDVEAVPVSWRIFDVSQAAFPASEFRELLACHLAEEELRLQRIVQARAKQEFDIVALEARTLASQAAIFGALRVSAAADRLDAACRSGAHGITYRLIGELSETCDAAGRLLQGWLESSGS